MKIRMKGNSIRLRLSKTDLHTLEKNLPVTDAVDFGETKLAYSLVPSSQHDDMQATFLNNTITINIPEVFSQAWNQNEIISIEARQKLSEGNSLYILVEKDFQCLDKTSEDQSDFFTNPNKTCQ